MGQLKRAPGHRLGGPQRQGAVPQQMTWSCTHPPLASVQWPLLAAAAPLGSECGGVEMEHKTVTCCDTTLNPVPTPSSSSQMRAQWGFTEPS